jgi:hypothetical protein
MTHIKQYSVLLAAALTLGQAWVGCDTIDEEDRFTAGDVTSMIFNSAKDTITIGADTWTVEHIHRLLIEDYTGWQCSNCPDMAEFIETQLVEQLDSNAVVVGLHMAGNQLSQTVSGLYFQLSTTLADTYGTYYTGLTPANIGLPAVAIDHVTSAGASVWTGVNDNTLLTATGVATAQYTRYNSEDRTAKPFVSLALNVTPTETADSYELKTLVLADELNDAALKLQLWMVEDSISGLQFSPSVHPYVHNHVLRDALNGTWGEAISFSEPEETGVPTSICTTTISLSDRTWVAKNCRVVAFVYRDDTKEVLNTIAVPLLSE